MAGFQLSINGWFWVSTEAYGANVATAIGVLLDTPRRLKLVARRVHSAWDTLHGELYFNDLLVLCVLREGAPDAFNFLLQNMDAARQKSTTNLDTHPKTVKAAWDKLIADHPNGDGVQKLVETLGFAQLSHESGSEAHPQGVANSEPTDYLRRALSERVDAADVRDQTVLSDIVAYRDGKSQVMVEKLSSTWERSPYLQRWEHFSNLLPTASLLPLAAKIVDTRLNNMQSGEKDEPILAIWRRVNRRLNKNDPDNVEWLSEQTTRTLPFSLSYSNALYYFWASRQYGIVNEAGRTKVREAVYKAAQNIFTNGAALRRALSSSDLWALRHLVQPVDHQEPASILSSPADWSWLAPVESLLLTNRQRIERIVRVLSSKDSAEARLAAVTQDVSDVERFRFVAESGLTVDLVIGAAKLLARCYLDAVPDETVIRPELEALAGARTSDTFDALHRLRLLVDRIDGPAWTAEAVPGYARLTVAMFMHSAWHYTFMTYFHLEQKAREAPESRASGQSE